MWQRPLPVAILGYQVSLVVSVVGVVVGVVSLVVRVLELTTGVRIPRRLLGDTWEAESNRELSWVPALYAM